MTWRWAYAVILALLGVAATARAEDVEVFSRSGCPHCLEAKDFLSALQTERPALTVRIHEVDGDPAALERLRALAAERGLFVPGVPAILAGGELLFGFDRPETTGARIRALLDGAPSAADPGAAVCSPHPDVSCEEQAVSAGIFGAIRLREVGLPAFTLLVGLLDGFNPCAMWVLLFLLSLLVNLKSRARMALIAGTFVLVSGTVYFAFMAAWLNVFLLIGLGRAVQVALGAIAVLVGGLNVKEFFAFKVGPSLTIPEAAKPGIYARVRAILQAEHLWGAMASVVVLAVLVNFVELLCTAGFPAVYTHALSAQRLPAWQNYGYLVLYNLAYMLDDAVMVSIAVATLSRRRLQEKEGRWLKLVSGVVMLALALVLLFKPAWLAVLG
ncbi:MAG: hypothetical protein AMXMBFR34_12240 [Myxococcaceae bacterium]